MATKRARRPKRGEHVTSGSFGDDVVVFQRVSKQYFVLDGAARRIWEAADGKTTSEAIVRAVGGRNASREAAAAVEETIDGLAELGILEV